MSDKLDYSQYIETDNARRRKMRKNIGDAATIEETIEVISHDAGYTVYGAFSTCILADANKKVTYTNLNVERDEKYYDAMIAALAAA
jgi:hypothetical protein